jgi:2,4-dienoyl-CoA reductase-like NADH-dependent reductase (Old Yellow Enzyme family)
MSSAFPHLFSSLRVGQLVLRNRIVSTPHATGYVTGYLHDEREVYYQREKAKGGVGLQFMGATNIVRTQGYLGLPANVDGTIVPVYRRIAAAVHDHGGLIGAQLTHVGAMGNASLQETPLLAPSAIANDHERQTPKEAEPEELREIATAFGVAARRVREGELDAVILQFGHGYLMSCFLSPRWNQRGDLYGGSIDGRLRFPLEVLTEVRRAVGRDFTVGVRISGDELLGDGIDVEEAVRIAAALSRSGLIDWIDVSSGNDADPLSKALHYGGMFVPHAAFVPQAAAVKKVVTVPVVAVGRIVLPETAERVLASGHADLVAMTRALIADPHLPRKVQQGRVADVRPCVGANEGCLGRILAGTPITCVQNPLIGRERDWSDLPEAAAPRRVLVVGGGPAGLEAARVAALRGHQVTLLEQSGALGGQVLLAARAPSRGEFAGIARWLIGQVERLPIEVRLGTKAGPELVEALDPDVVVLATGSQPGWLNVPGSALPHVVDVRAVLGGTAEVGHHVLVLDGDGYLTATGVADFLLGEGKQVQVVTQGLHVGDHIDAATQPLALKRLAEQRCVQTPTSWVRRIERDRVIAFNTLSSREFVIEPVDTVVLALPSVAESELYQVLRARSGRWLLHRVGDCLSPRRVDSAILEGQRVARAL